MKKSYCDKFKDIDRINEIDIETQTTANMTDVLPNVSYASILKQSSGMRSSNIPANISPQLASPISQVSESDLDLT